MADSSTVMLPPLSKMPVEIKLSIIEALMPTQSNDDQAQKESDLRSIVALFSLLRIDKEFAGLVMKYLYKANQIVAERTEQRRQGRHRPCIARSLHKGPCRPLNAFYYRGNGIDNPQPIISALAWVAARSAVNYTDADERRKTIENVLDKAGQYCDLRHVHIALTCDNLDVAKRMLSLPSVSNELEDINNSITESGLYHGAFVTTPCHPAYAILRYVLTHEFPSAHADLLREVLPSSTLWVIDCSYFYGPMILVAIDSQNVAAIRMVLDHEAQCTNSSGIHSRSMAMAMWKSTLRFYFSGPGNCYQIRDEISRRCRGTAWLAPYLLTYRLPLGDEIEQLVELAWRDIFDVPAEEWKGADTWQREDTLLYEGNRGPSLFLINMLVYWEVPRIARVLERYADSEFLDPALAPHELGELVKRAAGFSDHAKASEVVELLWKYSKNLEMAHFEGESLIEALDISIQRRHWGLVWFLKAHGVQKVLSMS